MPSSGALLTGSQVPRRSERMLGRRPRPRNLPLSPRPCQAPQRGWFREMPLRAGVRRPRCLKPLGSLGPSPAEELPGLKAGAQLPSQQPFLSCSTLPDSPPDSGSEAYSPQQVNGESSGHRPPPLGFGQVVGAALSGREGAREGGGQQPPNRPRLSLVKYSLALAIVSPRGGRGAWPCL